MKKFLMNILLCFLTICLISCRVEKNYKLLYPEEQISSIEIVSVTINESGEIEQDTKSIIVDIEAFLQDFYNLECYVYFGDPIGINESCTVIKIMYINNDYELIYWNGQAEYQNGVGLKNYTGYSVFEEDQFIKLISKYI